MKNLYLITYTVSSHLGGNIVDTVKETVEAESVPEALTKFMTPTNPDEAEEVTEFLNRIRDLTVTFWCRV